MNRIQGILHMHISLKGMVAAVVLALVLSACGNVSHNVAKDGSSAGQLVWPAPGDVTPMHKGGTFPDPAAVRAVQPGLNKQQIAQLIGYPHFDEGVWGVREWNYVFNFRDPATQQVTVCEYKILFDEHKLARSFYWNPEDCSRFIKQVAPSDANPNPAEQVTTLSADALFRFDRYARADITDGGRGQLDRLAESLLAERDRITHVHVIGYTDRLGSDAYNQTLSQRRADTIAAYLVERHVPSDLIDAQGRGKADPVVQCPDGQSRSALIACLATNRRVLVRVETRGT
jgi:OmpA-OmpF porin, OOP family